MGSKNSAPVSDKNLGASLCWRAVVFITSILRWFHAVTFEGFQKFPAPGKGAIIIFLHTTHNADLLFFAPSMFTITGRVVRGLIHRSLFRVYPWLSYFGMVPGDRKSAVELARAGFVVACVPGGSREGMTGHENAYSLAWEGQEGFAHVAKQANVPIYPLHLENAEEMRYNPIFHLWNLLYLSNISWWIFGFLPRPLQKVVKAFFEFVWFIFAYTLSIPLPSKVTFVLGDPIYPESFENVHELAVKAHQSLQELIDQRQGRRHRDIPLVMLQRFFPGHSVNAKTKSA